MLEAPYEQYRESQPVSLGSQHLLAPPTLQNIAHLSRVHYTGRHIAQHWCHYLRCCHCSSSTKINYCLKRMIQTAQRRLSSSFPVQLQTSQRVLLPFSLSLYSICAVAFPILLKKDIFFVYLWARVQIKLLNKVYLQQYPMTNLDLYRILKNDLCGWSICSPHKLKVQQSVINILASALKRMVFGQIQSTTPPRI